MPQHSAFRTSSLLSVPGIALLAGFIVAGCARNSQSASASASAGASAGASASASPSAATGASANARATRGPTADPNSLLSVTEGFDETVRRDVEKLRNATATFQDVHVAQAAGYPTNLPKCIADSTMGGMGRHYFDRAVFDGKLDIAHPEMLIYAPDATGKPDKLVGVEFVIPFSVLPSSEKPPRLFGQELRRHEDFKYWYLHVWAWKLNKAGLFSDWDPSIRCP